MKRKDQMNALKNLIELNDVNQQYKIIDIMLKGLFKVSHSATCTLSPQGWAEMRRAGGFCGGCGRWALGSEGGMPWGFKVGQLWQHLQGAGQGWQDRAVTKGSGRCWRTPVLCSSLPMCLLMGPSLRMRR